MDILDISIIVPVYNTGTMIKKCILPILELKDSSLEVICINDGSKDNSLEILESIKEIHNELIIVSKENGGLSSARNRGLEEAKGKYILFLDSDDWLNIEEFYFMKQYCQQNFDIIHGNFNYTYDDRESIQNKYQYEGVLSGQEFLRKALLTNKFSIPAWVNFYKKEFLLENGLKFMPEVYHEDEEFNIKAFSLASNIISKNIYFYNYYQRNNSITNNASNGEKRFLDILKIAEELSDFIDKNNFDQDIACILKTYISMVILSGYIRINDQKIYRLYYDKIKSMRLYKNINYNLIQFKILKFLLQFSPKLLLNLYRVYFNIGSKKI